MKTILPYIKFKFLYDYFDLKINKLIKNKSEFKFAEKTVGGKSIEWLRGWDPVAGKITDVSKVQFRYLTGVDPDKIYNTHNLKNTRNQKFLTFSIIILFWILKKFNHNQCEKS